MKGRELCIPFRALCRLYRLFEYCQQVQSKRHSSDRDKVVCRRGELCAVGLESVALEPQHQRCGDATMKSRCGDNKAEGIEEDVDEDNLRPVMMKWLEVMKLIKWSGC